MTSAVELLERQLEEIPSIGHLPWMDETERWAEFLFCVLYQIRTEEAGATRRAIETLYALDLTAPKRLAELSKDQLAIWKHALGVAGWTVEDVDEALAVLVHCSIAVERANGKPQLLLRQAASQMRDSIALNLANGGDVSPLLRAAVGRWLQNTCNLPIPVADEDVTAFAKSHKLSVAELIQAADHLDLNLAALDDVIAATKAK